MTTHARELAVAKRDLTPKQRLFLDWLMTPQGTRDHDTQASWCKANQVGKSTAAAWKADPKFRLAWDAERRRCQIDPERIDQVLNALHTTASNPGPQQVPAAKAWLEVADRFTADNATESPAEALQDLSDDDLDELLAQTVRDVQRARADGNEDS